MVYLSFFLNVTPRLVLGINSVILSPVLDAWSKFLGSISRSTPACEKRMPSTLLMTKRIRLTSRNFGSTQSLRKLPRRWEIERRRGKRSFQRSAIPNETLLRIWNICETFGFYLCDQRLRQYLSSVVKRLLRPSSVTSSITLAFIPSVPDLPLD